MKDGERRGPVPIKEQLQIPANQDASKSAGLAISTLQEGNEEKSEDIESHREALEAAYDEAVEGLRALSRFAKTLQELDDDGLSAARDYGTTLLTLASSKVSYEQDPLATDIDSADKLGHGLAKLLTDHQRKIVDNRKDGLEDILWWSKEGFKMREEALERIKAKIKSSKDGQLDIQTAEDIPDGLRLALHDAKRIQGLPVGKAFSQIGKNIRLTLALNEAGNLRVTPSIGREVTGKSDFNKPITEWNLEWEESFPVDIPDTLSIHTLRDQVSAYETLTERISENGKITLTARRDISDEILPILEHPDGGYIHPMLYDVSPDRPVSISVFDGELHLASWKNGTVNYTLTVPKPDEL